MTISTKEKITNIAIELFTKRGYQDVSVNEIIEKVGISKRTFYYHFASKEDILEEFYKIPAKITIDMLEKMLEVDNNFEKLMILYYPRIEHFKKMGKNISKQVLVTNIMDDKGTFKSRENPFEKMHEIEIELIKKAQEENEINNMADPKALTKILLSNMIGQIIMWILNDDDKESLLLNIEKDAKIILGVSY